MAGSVTPSPVRLRIVVGFYGLPWNPYHGAWGGKSFETRKSAHSWAKIARTSQLPVPKGLWPGPTPHKMVEVALVPYKKERRVLPSFFWFHKMVEVALLWHAPDRGQVIALCEPCSPRT